MNPTPNFDPLVYLALAIIIGWTIAISLKKFFS